MVKVFVSESEMIGPAVTDVKGIRGGREWVARSIQAALSYLPDGQLSIRWNETGIPSSLRKRIVVVYS